MKTKVIFKDFQIHTVPLEKLVYSTDEETHIFLDDVNEKRWKLTFIDMQALKLTSMDLGACHSFNIGGDFDEYYYFDQNATRRFFSSVFEVIDSEWLQELKNIELKRNKYLDEEHDYENDDLFKAKHFIVPLYDYELEVIAWDVKLEEVNK